MTLWAFVTVGTLCVLSLAQVHLRFMTRDLKIETRSLQQVGAELTNEKNSLISQVEELKRYDRLRQYAESELGLCKCPPSRVRRVEAAPAAVARWGDIQDAIAEVPGGDSPTENLLATVGEKMITWSNVALARDVSHRTQ
ncbi:hypothetical protein JW916_03940 [Candidatus Sumerlaeota bacterium]|nr:hypothetical protein [Candidatus Sumerlaeota bacterium]